MPHDQQHYFLLRTFDNRFTGCGATARNQMQHLEALYQHTESRLARMSDDERAGAPCMLDDEGRRLSAIETPYIAEAYLVMGSRRWPLTTEHRERHTSAGNVITTEF